MGRTFTALLLLFAPLSAQAEFRQEPTAIDDNQALTMRSAATLFCLQIRQDHRAGRSPDDCVMIDGRTMEARVGPEGAENSWTHHLAGIWCEGNRYSSSENRFQVRGEQSCQQLCDRSEEDRACITHADIGRSARRKEGAWRHIGEFQLVERPAERASLCTEERDHAEAWRVSALAVDRTEPSRRGPAPIPEYTAFPQPIAVHVICPDGIEIGAGDRFRALIAYGEQCLPWSSAHEEPCLYRLEPIEAPAESP